MNQETEIQKLEKELQQLTELRDYCVPDSLAYKDYSLEMKITRLQIKCLQVEQEIQKRFGLNVEQEQSLIERSKEP